MYDISASSSENTEMTSKQPKTALVLISFNKNILRTKLSCTYIYQSHPLLWFSEGPLRISDVNIDNILHTC